MPRGSMQQNTPAMSIRTPPDPSRGIFETLLVLDGEPVELEAHLRRLANSLAAVYAAGLPDGAEDLARGHAADLRHGRLRLTARPAREGVDLGAEAAEIDPGHTFPTAEAGVTLRSLQLPGGLGAHKWADRSPLGKPEPGVVPLLVDGAEALEAGWGNLFAVLDGNLVTPPLDGRILPGVTRALALAAAGEGGLPIRERRILAAELTEADEVLVTNSGRGVESPRSFDTAPLPPPGEVAELLRSALQARWRRTAGAFVAS